MNQKRSIPRLEDIIWAELLSSPSIKRLRRNEKVMDGFAIHGWITHTSRKDEFAITETGRLIAEKRLSAHWPAWREDLASFAAIGLSPEDAGAWNLLGRAQTNQIPRSLKCINRRTLNAWERRHSKVVVGAPSEPFRNARVTVDEVVRLRLPPGSTLLLSDGATTSCDYLMGMFGEIVIPERGWDRIKRIVPPTASVLISIENKGAFVDFPRVSNACFLFVPGDNTAAIHQVRSRMPDQPMIHFGDLDPEGIQIFESLLAQNLPVRHFVPGYVEEFVLTHAQPCKAAWPKQNFSSLHPVVGKLASNNLWLEHEALVLDYRFEAELQLAIQNALDCSR